MNRPTRDRILLIAFLIVLLAFGSLAGRKVFLSRTPPDIVSPTALQEDPRELREIILYFGSLQGERLIAESRQIACLDEVECVRETVQALAGGPEGPLAPVIPGDAAVRDVVVADGMAVVDFSREFVSDHPGGSLSELLTVYGLANTVAVNFPHLRQTRILVEGDVLDTLKGHVGVREPVQADFRYSRSSEEGE